MQLEIDKLLEVISKSSATAEEKKIIFETLLEFLKTKNNDN